MRAFKTTVPTGYVDWIVNDQPDNTGIYSGYPINSLINIIVTKTVSSKIENFLKAQNPSDGYFFHINSYDWLHPNAPITIPTKNTGIAIVRGSVDGITPRDYATILWNENTQQWKFAYNINGDGYTIGNSLPIAVGDLQLDGYITIGNNSAQSGIIRIPNQNFINSRNVLNNADITLIGTDNLNRVQIGSLSSTIHILNNLTSDGYIVIGNNPSQSGLLRTSSSTTIITSRNSSNSADLTLLSTDASNRILLGSTSLAGHIFNTSSSSLYDFQINSSSQLQIGSQFIRYGVNPATTGFLRAPNNSIGAAARNAANNDDVLIWSVDNFDILQLGTNNNRVSINANNISLMSAIGSFANGNKVIFIINATSIPDTFPSGGGVLYVDNGALKYVGSNGTITTIASA